MQYASKLEFFEDEFRNGFNDKHDPAPEPFYIYNILFLLTDAYTAAATSSGLAVSRGGNLIFSVILVYNKTRLHAHYMYSGREHPVSQS